MRFAIEFSTDAERDFDLIFDHLFESYVAFGEGTEEALEHAGRRVMDIRKAVDRLASFPLRGARHATTSCQGSAFLAIARAIYWFDIDRTARKVRILAVFFGGQDHIRHMLVRLLGRRETR